MTHAQIKELRKRCWHYLHPDVAACAGLSLGELQQFVAGAFMPEESSLHALAIRLQLYPAGQNA